jgi:hypothetical protein
VVFLAAPALITLRGGGKNRNAAVLKVEGLNVLANFFKKDMLNNG